MKSRWIVALLILAPCCAGVLAAQATPAKSAENDAQVHTALSAAPKEIANGAGVLLPGPDGKLMEVRPSRNGWMCMPDQPETPGKDPMCLDPEAQKWANSWMAHEPKPGNTAPGLIYMLRGGSDISWSDPWAKPDRNTKFVESPAHYMIMWPFDPKASGLSDKPKTTGSWIMWAGTPYAHIMVNQTP
jgi:hypothetical protein